MNALVPTLIVIPLLAAALASAADLPTAAQVGPAAMPTGIEPIVAPFEMPVMARPEFAPRRVVLDLSGYSRDELITEAVQQAIDETSAGGGGTVVVPPGVWQSGRIVLKSGVELHLPKQATLQFSGRIRDYLPVVFARYEGLEVMSLGGLIYAHNAEHIGLTGEGLLVGPDEGPVREARRGLSDQVVDAQLPVEQRVMDGRKGRHYFRPQFVCLMHCHDVLVEGVTLRNGPMWNVVPTYCQQVIIRGVTVESRGVVNGDGVNIESSRDVLVEYCQVDTGDDCFAMKSGRGIDGIRAGQPVENVVLRYNRATGGFGGITFGSETAGCIRNVYARDCVFDGVRHATYFKTRRPRGGGGEHITIERLRFSSTSHGIFFDMIGSPLYVGDLGNRLPRRDPTPVTPFYRDIVHRDIKGYSSEGDAVKIKGIPESPASNLVLERIDIAAHGLPNLADASDLALHDCVFRAELPELKLRNATQAEFVDCQFDTGDVAPVIVIAENTTEQVQFRGTQPALAADHLRLLDGATPTAAKFQP